MTQLVEGVIDRTENEVKKSREAQGGHTQALHRTRIELPWAVVSRGWIYASKIRPIGWHEFILGTTGP
jgi:hypothetical protein